MSTPNTADLPREFRFNGARLPDPDRAKSAEEVRQIYANAGYPALTNGSVAGPEVINGRNVYTFKAAVGTKG